MDAIFNIKGNEFDESLFKKIKALLRKKEKATIFIRVTDESGAYHQALQKSIDELKNPDKLVSFSMENLEEYTAKKKTR